MIRTTNLAFSYPGTNERIVFPDFEIGTGTPCLLLGESGSGKTTLLHLLGGLLRTQEGQISIGETNLSKLTEMQLDKFRAKHMGFIFQKNHLITALSVRMNLLLAPYLAGERQDRGRVKDVLRELSLSDKENAKIHELSLGQAQRVAIARAIINKPKLILADEPTSALDDTNCERAIQLLLAIARQNNSTLVVATHDHRLKAVIANQVNLKAVKSTN